MDYGTRFWANIERLVKEKNLNWTELSRLLNMSRVGLIHAKSLKSIPRAERLKKLSDVLGVTVDELLNI